MFNSKTSILLIFIILLNHAFSGYAKNPINYGILKGRIIDKATLQALPGANVNIIGTEKGSSTDSNGVFTINQIEEGIYKILVCYMGYHDFVKPDIRIIQNKTTFVEEIRIIQKIIQGVTITVTAGLFQEDKEAPVSNFTYTREEIRRSPGAGGDILRALAALPGVASFGAEFSAFSVRGGSPLENIILVDNIPFNKITHLGGGGTEEEIEQGGRYSIFTPGIIEEANFQAGGFPARYGGKLSSILNLHIKEGNEDDMTLNGHYDILGWETNYSGPALLLNNTSILFSARHTNFTNILKIMDQEDVGEPQFTDIIFKTTSKPNPQNKISLLGIYGNERVHVNIDHVYTSEDLSQTDIVDNQESKYLLGLNWRCLTGKNSFLRTSLYYINSDQNFKDGRVYTDPINGIIPTKEEAPQRKYIEYIHNKDSNLGLKSEFIFNFSNLSSMTTGFNLQFENYHYTTFQKGTDTSYVFDKDDYRPSSDQKYIILLPENFNTNIKKKHENISAFSDLSLQLTPRLTLNCGLRYEYYTYNSRNYISPRLSIRYQLNPRTSLNTATGIFYQKPDFDILSDNIQNLKLNNEKAYHYIFGITNYVTNELKLTGEIYYKIMNDLFVIPDHSTTIIKNSGDGWARGIDVSLIKRFVKNFYWQISYSFSQCKRNDHDGTGFYNSPFNQPHIFNILGSYEINKEWSISAKWKYASGKPKDSFIVHSNVFNDPDFIRYSKEITGNNDLRLPAMHTLNIHVDYRKQFKYFALIAFIDLGNVYGRLNITEERFLEKNGKIDPQGFELVPTIGSKIEF